MKLGKWTWMCTRQFEKQNEKDFMNLFLGIQEVARRDTKCFGNVRLQIVNVAAEKDVDHVQIVVMASTTSLSASGKSHSTIKCLDPDLGKVGNFQQF